MKKLLDWLVGLFKVDYSEFVLDGERYDLSEEDIKYLHKKIEEKFQ